MAAGGKEEREGHAVAGRLGAREQLFGIGAGEIAKARAGAMPTGGIAPLLKVIVPPPVGISPVYTACARPVLTS